MSHPNGLLTVRQIIAPPPRERARPNRAKPIRRCERPARKSRAPGAAPEHLPRVEIGVEPEDTACPCCSTAMHVIGKDRSQRLDVIPAQYQVVTRRPKYACRTCAAVYQP